MLVCSTETPRGLFHAQFEGLAGNGTETGVSSEHLALLEKNNDKKYNIQKIWMKMGATFIFYISGDPKPSVTAFYPTSFLTFKIPPSSPASTRRCIKTIPEYCSQVYKKCITINTPFSP